MKHARGMSANAAQVALLVAQVALVGLMLGTLRTVVPALAEDEFGVARGSILLLVAFVVAFGVVKAVLNFVAGRWSERAGRRRVLIAGWLSALPIPLMLYLAPSWGWVVTATVLLGINQGLCWSMTQTAKLDLTRADERGLVMGLNEFAGYVGVAIGGIVTSYAAGALGPRLGLLVFGFAVIALGLGSAVALIRESLPWARAEAAAPAPTRAAYPTGLPAIPSTAQVFAVMTWRDRRLAALCQAGLVEKFVDALIWVAIPVYLHQRGASLPQIGWIVGSYGMVWGIAQLGTGRLSDRVGRFWPNVAGMWICGAGVGLFALGEGSAWWSVNAAIAGFGMALLYPNLSASVADITPPAWRGSAIGIYRFWRDLGYAIGALGLGLAAQWAGDLTGGVVFVALSMAASGLWLFVFGAETHPRFAPLPEARG